MSTEAAPVVLVVEDESLLRMLAVDMFEEEGFVVLEAEHAAEALLTQAAHGDIALLFTDVNMPGELNGIDLAERLKALVPTLQIIVTSALPMLRPVDHIPAIFISKPYDTRKVREVARRLLAA
jgi:CheY-like chemotaxis protein